LRVFDDFLLHRMGDTPSAKNHQKLSNYQHINHSRYDSTAFSRFKELCHSVGIVKISDRFYTD
jgi:hypothetical protein